MAKSVFQLHGADAKGKAVSSKRLHQNKHAGFIARLSPCLTGMKACQNAHYWAQLFEKIGAYCKVNGDAIVKPDDIRTYKKWVGKNP